MHRYNLPSRKANQSWFARYALQETRVFRVNYCDHLYLLENSGFLGFFQRLAVSNLRHSNMTSMSSKTTIVTGDISTHTLTMSWLSVIPKAPSTLLSRLK